MQLPWSRIVEAWGGYSAEIDAAIVNGFLRWCSVRMNETSISLLNQLREAPETDLWNRLHRTYEPLLRKWLLQYDVQGSDADDVAQEVFLAISRDISKFSHNGRNGAFRAWVKGILVNRLREFWRSRGRNARALGGSDMNRRLSELEDPSSHVSQVWDKEHDQFVLRELLRIVMPSFKDSTWQAFKLTAIEGQKPTDVAKKLGISVNAVVIAKSRVLNKLRCEAEGMVESSTDILRDS